MEQIKIYDKYIDRLSDFDSLRKSEQELLFEEITKVIFSEDELKELVLSYYSSYSEPNYKEDAVKLKAKLEFMRAEQIDNERKENLLYERQKMELEQLHIKAEMQKTNLTINNTNHNESTSSAFVSISFEEVRNKIDKMTSLCEEEIDEIKDKIDEIEKIVNSGESKVKKWTKAKDIIKWIADKGVDVGIALLPLLLNIS